MGFMGIFERLENVIKSHINDGKTRPFKKGAHGRDPDLEAAYEELDDFLRGDDKKNSKAWDDLKGKEKIVPEEIRKHFAELGLSPDATAEECKDAYKKLLKVHHPDRHGKDQEKLKKATEKSARVNAAYEQIEKWFKATNGKQEKKNDGK